MKSCSQEAQPKALPASLCPRCGAPIHSAEGLLILVQNARADALRSFEVCIPDSVSALLKLLERELPCRIGRCG